MYFEVSRMDSFDAIHVTAVQSNLKLEEIPEPELFYGSAGLE